PYPNPAPGPVAPSQPGGSGQQFGSAPDTGLFGQALPPSPTAPTSAHGPETPDEQPWLGASMPPGRRRRSGSSSSAGGDAAGTGDKEARADARPSLSRRSRRPKTRPQTPLQAAIGAVTEVVVVLGMALALSLLIKTFLVQAFFIPSQSMEDTLLVGDRVLVSKLTPGPFELHRGDVIVFKDPGSWLEPTTALAEGPVRSGLRTALTFVGLLPQDSGEHLIKRVIGLPGDTVTCCDAKGRLTVNGKPIDEPYVRAGNVPSTEKFTVKVQQAHLWVMGDNRSESADSRFHRALNDGQVPVSDVVGKAFVVVWPFARFGGVADPPSVFSAVPAAAAR
ncbi:MAG TPA: signal peptidase I, partial [Kineosporiaceae bacterium]|nr:signal peptidase I [Kineosporiaceae bacterium]